MPAAAHGDAHGSNRAAGPRRCWSSGTRLPLTHSTCRVAAVTYGGGLASATLSARQGPTPIQAPDRSRRQDEGSIETIEHIFIGSESSTYSLGLNRARPITPYQTPAGRGEHRDHRGAVRGGPARRRRHGGLHHTPPRALPRPPRCARMHAHARTHTHARARAHARIDARAHVNTAALLIRGVAAGLQMHTHDL